MRPVALLAAALLLGGAAPSWQNDVAGAYVGRVWNSGEMVCARAVFSVEGGKLVGHYWVDDKEPFEGTLTGFMPEGDHGGSFIWSDRDGHGAYYIRFAADGLSFRSMWGIALPDPDKPGYGLRGPDANVPGCTAPPVS